MPHLRSGAATDRPETTILILQPIPEVVWQQPQQTHSTIIHKILNTEIQKNTHMPEFRQRNDVESQTSPTKEISPQVSGSSTEPFLRKQTVSMAVQSLNDNKKPQSENQRHQMNITANDNGDDNFSLPKLTN